MKSGDVDTVMGYVFHALHTRVEAAVPGYCWGWSYRANVNNPNQLSNHSSATAGDYNAPYHPNGTSTGPNGGGGWTGAQYSEIHRILDEVENSVEWLSGNDPMHFDIKVSASVLAGVANRLREGDQDMTPDEVEQSVRNALMQFWVHDMVTMDADEMSTPATYQISRQNLIERGVRLASIAGARVTGRDGKYAVTKTGGGR
jgi:hypothetical protein